jgi:hypothetical protein
MIIATSSPKKFKIGAALIKFYQNTSFSHVLIIKDDLVYQASHGFVNCMHMDNFLVENEIIHQYEISDESVDFEFVKKQLGKPYSYKQILNIATKFLIGIKLFSKNDNSQFICSEFVGKALKLDWVTDDTTPLEIDNYLKDLAINR